MGFESGSGYKDSQAADLAQQEHNLFGDDASLIAKQLDAGAASQVERAGWEELFGTPVVDSRLGTPLPDIFAPHDGRVDSCDSHRPTKTQEDALESTAKGNSVLHRMYEVAVLTPPGKIQAKDFESVYGASAAAKMSELGITEVRRSKTGTSVQLKNPLHYGDANGSIDVSTTVSFASRTNAGALSLDNIQGVTARSGMFQVQINRLDLQPREDGYMSGHVTAQWSQTRICALPDGTIYR